MSPILVAVLLVVLVAAAFAAGYVTARRRAPAPAPPRREPEPAPAQAPASLATIVKRTGAELTQIAVQTGVDIGTRVVRDSLGTLSAWAVRERPDLRRVTGEDGTVTLMFSDIEGSTSLNERLGDDAWLKVLSVHDKLVRRCIRADRGQVIKTLGDSFMAAFARADRALACAIAVQRELAAVEWHDGAEIRVRIGLHTGEAIARGRDLFGVNVATASRVAGQAKGGEILVTSAVAERTGQSANLGRARAVSLKGLSGTQRVHSVAWRTDD
jgi:adenylate cyclase